MTRLLAILAVCVLSGGCAVGVTHEYDAADTKFNVETEAEVAVATHDQRPYVIEGGKTENFVGLSRGGWGNPFDITTASNNSLADDFSASIVSGFTAGNVKAKAVQLSPQDKEPSARAALLAAKANRYVMLTINEWKSDTYANTKIVYDILLRVFDASGTKRAAKQLFGEDHLGGSAFNPTAHSRLVVPVAFRSKLKELFNDPEIKSALQ